MRQCSPSSVRSPCDISWRSADWVDARSSFTSSATALAVMLYALYTFHWRAAAIRKRSTAPYDDRVGPVRRFRLPKDLELMEPTHPPLDYLVHCTVRYVLLNVDSRPLDLRFRSGCYRQLCPPIHSRLKESGYSSACNPHFSSEGDQMYSRFRYMQYDLSLVLCYSSTTMMQFCQLFVRILNGILAQG